MEFFPLLEIVKDYGSPVGIWVLVWMFFRFDKRISLAESQIITLQKELLRVRDRVWTARERVEFRQQQQKVNNGG